MLTGLWGYLAAAGGAVIALVAAYLGIKAKGRAEARAEQEARNADAIVAGAQVRDRVRDAGVDAARERLRRSAIDRPRD